MKKVLLGLAALTVLLIVTVVVAPSFIDWTSYRNGIAAEIERVLHRRVVIDGAVEAAIIPTPRLSLHGARLGNLPGASSPTMAQVESLEVRVAFWPLLTGRIVVTSVVLHKPIIELEILADGRRNWLFPAPTSAVRPSAEPAEGLPEGVQFENAVITDGTIIYRDARSNAEERVEGVNARFAAEGLYGPLRAAGEVRYGALPLRFTLATGRLDPRGQAATPLNLTAEIPADRHGQPARGSATFTGTFRLPDIGPQLSGQLKLRGEDLTSFIAALGVSDDAPFILAQAFNLEGTIELKDDTLNGNDLALQLGETRMEGAVSASFPGDQPQLDVALSVGRVDLDAWFAAAIKKRAEQVPSETAAAREPREFVLPAGWRMTLDVAVDAVTYHGGAARQAKLTAEMADGVIDIYQLAVRLPGSADGMFNGKLLAADGRPRLDGFAELSSDDFRSLLAWLDMDVSDLPAGRLNKLSATSRVSLTSDRLDLGDLDLRFDSTHVTGALVAALRQRPALGINLIVDHFNLDSYMPGATQSPPEGAALAASQAAAAAIPLDVLAEFDANLRLRVGQLAVGTATARDINLDGTLLNGVLTMRKLAIDDLDGGTATLAGTLNGFDGKVRMNLQFDVEANEPTGLLRAAGVALPFPGAALAPFSASGELSGSSAGYKINGVVNAAMASLTVVGDLALPPQGPAKFGFDLDLDHPNYVGFVRMFDPAFAPEQEAGAQAVSLKTRIERSADGYNLSAISGAFGPLTLQGNAALAFDGALPRITAQLAAGDIDTRHFLSAPEKKRPAAGAGKIGAPPVERWSAQPIDMTFAKIANGSLTLSGKTLRHGKWRIDEPRSEIAIDAGGIEVKQLSGRMLGGELAAHGRFLPGNGTDTPMTLDYGASLTGATLGTSLFNGANIDLSGGRFDLSLEGTAAGASEAALIAGLSGKGSVAFTNTVLKGFDLARLNARFAGTQSPGELVRLIQSAMSSGSTKVDDLRGDFTINGGIVGVDNLQIRSPAGEVSALVAADLPQWRLDATVDVRLADNAKGPSFGMQLNGPLDAPKRDVDSDALQTFLLEEIVRRAKPGVPPAPQGAPAQRRLTPPASTSPNSGVRRQSPAAPTTVPRNAPRGLDTPPDAPGSAAPPAATPPVATPPVATPSPTGPVSTQQAPAQPVPRVLNVSPDAPNAATPPQNAPRVLNVSPDAPGAATPPQNAPRVLNVSPNAATPAPAAPGSNPAVPSESVPRVLNVSPNAAQPSGQPASPAQGGESDAESFSRQILRELGP